LRGQTVPPLGTARGRWLEGPDSGARLELRAGLVLGARLVLRARLVLEAGWRLRPGLPELVRFAVIRPRLPMGLQWRLGPGRPGRPARRWPEMGRSTPRRTHRGTPSSCCPT
jgi:hypothetical protein